MATVFLCEDETLGRRVAVKRLHSPEDPEHRRRFRREAELGAGLSHPNLITVFDTIEDEDGALIVMEYVEGPTLAEVLRGGAPAPADGLALLAGVGAGLDHAHEHGVVHRDVKPSNVILPSDSEPKLADLGIASASHLTRTTTGEMIVGTLAYMAPERLEGRDAGPAGDVYSFGAVAFEVFSGRRARRATTPAEAVAEGLRGGPADLREAWADAPGGAALTLGEAMAVEPQRRPSSAGEVVSRLREALAGEPTTATVAIPAEAGWRAWPAGRLLAAGVLAFVALVIVVAALTGGGGETNSGKQGRRAENGAAGSASASAGKASSSAATTPEPPEQTAPAPAKPKPAAEPKAPKEKPAKKDKGPKVPPGHGGEPPGQAKK